MLLWLIRFTGRRARGTAGPCVTTLSLRGLSFTLDWAAAEHVPLREIVGRQEYWPTEAFRPSRDQVVVDVGANAGVFSTVAASWIGPAGRLVAIEPNPAAVGRLTRNLRANGFTGRSTVIEAAASDHRGIAILFVGANSPTATLAPPTIPGSDGIEVHVVPLDEIASQLGIGSVDLLKVDVEGVEAEVLDGARSLLTTCHRAVIEVSEASDVGAVTERCRRAGFTNVVERRAGPDSGATIVFAER